MSRNSLVRIKWLLLGLGVAVIPLSLAWFFAPVESGPLSLTKVRAADNDSQLALRNDLMQSGRFIQIPGPNPIVVSGGAGAWDEYYIEAADEIGRASCRERVYVLV